MARETILVVDDDETLCHLLEHHILNRLGYAVKNARDGRQGLQLAQTCKPDLILLDMNMPRMSGMEMLATLRKCNINTPVIFMTGGGSEYVAVQAFRLGVFDYLSKPFSPKEVAESVDRALQVTRLTQEKENLSQALVAAETVRQTVATLAHYLNNQLMVANGGLELCQELLQESVPVDQAAALEILTDSRKSVRRIEAVLRVMNKISHVELTTYHDSISILNIEAAVQQELADMNRLLSV